MCRAARHVSRAGGWSPDTHTAERCGATFTASNRAECSVPRYRCPSRLGPGVQLSLFFIFAHPLCLLRSQILKFLYPPWLRPSFPDCSCAPPEHSLGCGGLLCGPPHCEQCRRSTRKGSNHRQKRSSRNCGRESKNLPVSSCPPRIRVCVRCASVPGSDSGPIQGERYQRRSRHEQTRRIISHRRCGRSWEMQGKEENFPILFLYRHNVRS